MNIRDRGNDWGKAAREGNKYGDLPRKEGNVKVELLRLERKYVDETWWEEVSWAQAKLVLMRHYDNWIRVKQELEAGRVVGIPFSKYRIREGA